MEWPDLLVCPADHWQFTFYQRSWPTLFSGTLEILYVFVSVSVCHNRQPCKNGWTNRGTFGVWNQMASRNHVLELLLHYNRFTALFLWPPGWPDARRELLDSMVQGKINRGRHTNHPDGCPSIRTNQCSPPQSPRLFYRLDALPSTQPTVSKHWRRLRSPMYGGDFEGERRHIVI